MKGTVYLWVLAAVLSGALVGLLGFVVEGVFNVQSSVMEPVIIGAIAGVVAVLITAALFRNGKAD
jgi:membrane protein DedA with SNARE-associated domain